MTTVKGKTRLCQSNLSDFNVELVNGSPFFKRYGEFLRVFKKHIKEYDPEVLFAQPEENTSKGTLDWYIPSSAEAPESLFSMKTTDPESYARYSAERDAIIAKLKQTTAEVPNQQEKDYLNCAIKFLDSEHADKLTFCYDDKVTFAVWGMNMRKGRDIATVIKEDVKEHRIHTITYRVQGQGRIVGQTSILRKHGHILQGARDIPEVKPEPHHSFAKWTPDAPQGKTVDGDMDYTAVCVRSDDYGVTFAAADGGTLQGACALDVKPGGAFTQADIPTPMPLPGYHFVKWEPEIAYGQPVDSDLAYTALFAADTNDEPEGPEMPPPPPPMHNVTFDAGQHGTLSGGQAAMQLVKGEHVPAGNIPAVKPKRGYKFTGWDKSFDEPVTGDTVYTAQYEKKLPWWRRFWLWLTGAGCLTWLLRLLALLLALLLIYWLLRSCHGCDGIGHHKEVNGVAAIDSIKTSDGRVIDDNGTARPITGEDGRLPEGGGVVAPVMGEGGQEPPIIERPGVPDIIANRLFLFMEDAGGDIDALAADFKKAYPGDEYSIIGFDREVKMLVVQVPEGERDQIRQSINAKIPNHKFLVFDEQVYTLKGQMTDDGPSDPGWHLKAIHLQQGWKYTKGSNKVKVAVVDDGIQADHPMFKGRIVDAYNVYTQNNRLSLGEGHGTHTAGLAAGCADFYQKGASGVAPGCLLMPVQVFDNGRCPMSALVAGIMYAIHHKADVVNISIGPSFDGLNALPVPAQEQIAREQFINESILWKRVSDIAARNKCILVFAAGNDDILTSIPPENRNASALAITAVDKNLRPTDFTNYGPCSDVSAPGDDIYSSFPRSTFKAARGTSQAAPIVAGTIALMKSLKKDLTVEQARNVLQRTGAKADGNVPPVVLVDKALEAVKRGDFSAPAQDTANDDANGGRTEGETPPPAAPAATGGQTTDYEAIRRLIREYQGKIDELKKQLPENQ